MKASKFPVTYNGEQFRVSVAEYPGRLGDPTHIASVYVRRSGFFARIAPFCKVDDSKFFAKDSDDAFVHIARCAVRDYVGWRNARREERETEAAAWRKFAEWDGEVGS